MSLIYSFFEFDSSVSGTTNELPAIAGELSNFTRTFGEHKRYVIPSGIDGALLVFNPDDAVDVPAWNWDSITTLETMIVDLEGVISNSTIATTPVVVAEKMVSTRY